MKKSNYQMRKECDIALRHLKAVPLVIEMPCDNTLHHIKSEEDINYSLHLLNRDMVKLGYVMSHELFKLLLAKGPVAVDWVCNYVFPLLKSYKGDDVTYKPMYPNFPEQVENMDEVDLYMNAIVHYWSFGEWLPEYEKLHRENNDNEEASFISLGVTHDKEVLDIYKTILASRDSLSFTHEEDLDYFLNHRFKDLPTVNSIPYKETMCKVATSYIDLGLSVRTLVSTTTDVLRLASYLSGGDHTLTTNTKFKGMGRRKRKILLELLERVIKEEDIARHKGKWKRLFHHLHAQAKGGKETRKIAKRLFDRDSNIRSYASFIEELIREDMHGLAAYELQQRPGELARRLDHLLRDSADGPSKRTVIKSFKQSMYNNGSQVSTRVLAQLAGLLKHRKHANDLDRIILPKGPVAAKAINIGNFPKHVDDKTLNKIQNIIQRTLANNIKTKDKESLGRVFVDPLLAKCPLPTGQRSSSQSLHAVARGTRLPLHGNKNFLRMFIYWKGGHVDIDLSAYFCNEDFTSQSHVSYTNLRDKGIEAYHSGDITTAPNGASEFIDINIKEALEAGYRYAVMNVYSYSSHPFNELKSCYAGWMTRKKPQSGEVYDPKTVEQKCDLTSAARNAIPVIFDFKTREAIWVDLSVGHNPFAPVNLESNRASIQEVFTHMTNLYKKKITLYELFSLHARVRGELVDTREEADTVFAFDGDVTPYDVLKINSEFME